LARKIFVFSLVFLDSIVDICIQVGLYFSANGTMIRESNTQFTHFEGDAGEGRAFFQAFPLALLVPVLLWEEAKRRSGRGATSFFGVFKSTCVTRRITYVTRRITYVTRRVTYVTRRVTYVTRCVTYVIWRERRLFFVNKNVLTI
jgi:hypothetical protein